MTYLDKIEHAIINLEERKGSSRQAIWKFIRAHHVDADYKQFLIRLRAAARNGDIVVKKQRFKVNVKKILK